MFLRSQGEFSAPRVRSVKGESRKNSWCDGIPMRVLGYHGGSRVISQRCWSSCDWDIVVGSWGRLGAPQHLQEVLSS
jgi:hypothetical protein